MNKLFPFALVVLLGIFPLNNCYSQDMQDISEEQDLETVDGKVVAVDTSSSVITIKATTELTFSVPLNTPVMDDINGIKLSDVDPGDDVTIEHYKDPSGKLIATKITVEYR